MKKGILKVFLSILVFCTFLISGCEFNKSKTASTVTITVRTEFENMRSAIPTINIDDYTWSVSAKKSDGTEASSPSEPETSRLYFFNDITEGTWTFTVIGKKEGKTVFSGTKEIKIKNGTNYSETIFANYVDNSSDNGSIDLQIVLSEMGSFDINVYKDSIEKSNIVSLTNNEYGKKLSIPSIPQGDYDFYFEIKNGTTTICVIKQKICVRANVTTDRWIYSGEVYIIPIAENVAMFKLTKKIIQNYVDTNIYVHGDGGTLSAPAAGSTGNGSWNNPYTSLKAAFDKVKVLNDGVTPYTIWIDGEVVNNDTTSSGYLFSENSLGINLSILGLNGSNNKDVIDLNRRCGLISIDPEKAEDTVVPSVNIKNLTIINASALNGSVIYNSNNVIKAVIDNCYFKENTATTNGGVFQFSASDGNLEIRNSIFEGNSAKFGGAISTAAQTTIYNCTFTKNHASFGGAINSESSGSNHITLSGKVIAQNNYITEDENKLSNIYLNENEQLFIDDVFSGESRVGVTGNTGFTSTNNYQFTFTEGYSYCDAKKDNLAPSAVFFSDNNDYSIISSETEGIIADLKNVSNDNLPDSLIFYFNKTMINISKDASENQKIISITLKFGNNSLTSEQLSSLNAKVYYKGICISDKSILSDFNINFSSFNTALQEGTCNIIISGTYNGIIYGTQKKVTLTESSVADSVDSLKEFLTGASKVVLNNGTYSVSDSVASNLSSEKFTKTGSSVFTITEAGNYTIDGNNSTISNTSSEARVFAISGVGTEVVIENLIFTSTGGNADWIDGKVILVENGAKLTLKNCKIYGFRNKGRGFVQVVNGCLTIDTCEFTNNAMGNTNSGEGGIVLINPAGSCTIKNSTISNNSGLHLGAAVFNEGSLKIYGGTISGNTAQRAAGVYSSGSELYMKGVTIKENKVEGTGYYANAAGGLWVGSPGPTRNEDKSIKSYNPVTVIIEDCTFKDNKCGSWPGQTLEDGVTKAGNEHSGGGAIYIDSANLIIKNCKITGNLSGKNGGAIQIYYSTDQMAEGQKPTLNFEGINTFTDNSITDTSTYKGRVLYISSSRGAIINGTTYNSGTAFNDASFLSN